MSKEELIEKLKKCQDKLSPEGAHADADEALLEYINDEDIRAAYESVPKWYS